MKKINIYFKRHKFKAIFLIILSVTYYLCLPNKLFKNPTSTVVTANNDDLLGAIIANDGQWRFPELDTVPEKFKHCILQFEDAYFYKHFGFNPVSISKAVLKNIKAKRVVRGGSTLTQQVIRMSRNNKKRSYFEKIQELILSTRLEFRYSKDKILNLYASHAPFGGNVVGLEMASWRYFGLQPHQLSWAETATLAVLPNAPALIYPGKNQKKLKLKRDRLLGKLYQQKIIDSITCVLATEERLPTKPYNLPQIAPHFVQRVAKKHKGKRIKSSVDIFLQKKINEVVKQQHAIFKQNEVHNASVLVLDVETRKVLGYVGNTPTNKKYQKDVDNVISARSTGSVLKPFLYAQMLQSGDLLPNELVVDIPTEIAGYAPQNYSLSFDGAVPANEALTRSLNVPAVRMLKSYGLEKFREDLKEYQFKDINKTADYYGLSLILGGAEASLWDLCNVFAGYAGTVNHYETLKHRYYKNEFLKASYLFDNVADYGKIQKNPQIIDAGSSFLTLNVLTEVNRPTTDQAWKFYDSSEKIAWKTGTSFGNRDAWAIGTTAKYVVGVWVGNSDGEGRPNLTGVGTASPLMFEVFDALPKTNWFLTPFEDLIEENICDISGNLALPICKSSLKRIQKNGVKAKPCPYHIEVQVDKTAQYRVHTNCESVRNIITKPWFVLPPLQAYYYKQNNAAYKRLPDFRQDCNVLEEGKMEFLFPSNYYSKVSLVKNITGDVNNLILKLTHINARAKVYWYLNDKFIKETDDYHEIIIKPSKGLHKITVIDNLGNELKRVIEVE